jgi:hypothetical protein
MAGQTNRKSAAPRTTARPPTAAAAATRVSRGPVDAPGKHHRKPLPDEPLDKRMGEAIGKKMGQKTAKSGMRGGR